MTKKTKLVAMGLIVAATGLAGCAGRTAVTKSAEQTVASTYLSGKVTETMTAGGYSYLSLEQQDGKKIWAALPVSKIAVGDEIKILKGAVMSQFESKALNRTFDEIVFSGGLYQEPSAEGVKVVETPAEATSEQAILAGKVIETMNAASYTYIYLEKDGKRGWVAVPATQVEVGEELEVIPGIDAGKFKSSTLKREFDRIHFSAGIKGAKERKAAALPDGHPTLDAAAAASAPAAPAAPPISGKVVETAHAGGYTYVCLEKDGVKTWAAVPAMSIAVGEELTLAPGTVMRNFVSKSMNRTFERITFTSRPKANQTH